MLKQGLDIRRFWGWICIAFAIACGVLIMVPFAPGMPRLDLDGSWPLAINVGMSRHLVFGRDLIFTAGPLSAVYTHQYFPWSDTSMMVGSLVIALVVTSSLIIATPVARRPWLLLLPLALTFYGMTDVLFLLIPWLLVLLAVHRPMKFRAGVVVIHLMVGACALLPLVKGSATLSAALCVGLVALYMGTTKRLYLLSVPAIFVLSMAIAWRLSGQGLRNLPAYFLSQSAVISGYGDAMSMTGPSGEIWVFVIAACALMAFCLCLRREVRLPVMLATALTLLISMKAGMVRHDAHASFAACSLVMVGIYLFFALDRAPRYLALLVGLVPGLVINAQYVDMSPTGIIARAQTIVVDQFRGAAIRLTDRNDLDRRYNEAVAAIRKAVPIREEGLTADLYTSDVSALIFSNQQWTPRPTFQSYAAYTPSLIQLNVDHLRDVAPERIYFRPDPIDHRYPSLGDGASWPWLLGSYRPLELVGEYLVLGRSGAAHPLPIGKPVIARFVRLGETVELPRGTPLWVTIKVRPTLGGAILGALFKRPPISLHLRFANGRDDSYRVIPGMMETGFLLSPTIRDSKDLLALWTGDSSAWQDGNVPVSMQLELPEGGLAWWGPQYELSVAPFPVGAVPKPLPHADAVTAASSTFEIGGQCNVEKLDGADIAGNEAVVRERIVSLAGWAAISATMGVSNTEVALLVKDANGNRTLIHARKIPRGDVAAAFHHQELANAGFEANIDTSTLALPAHVTVVQSLGGASMECAQRQIVLEQ